MQDSYMTFAIAFYLRSEDNVLHFILTVKTICVTISKMANEADRRKKRRGDKAKKKEHHGKYQPQRRRYMDITDFLFESAYQIVTWVVIGLSIAAIAVFY